MSLLKDPAKALEQLKELQTTLQGLSSYLFCDVHAADQDFETMLFDHLYKAEKASMELCDRLVSMNEEKKKATGLGCKIRQDNAAELVKRSFGDPGDIYERESDAA